MVWERVVVRLWKELIWVMVRVSFEVRVEKGETSLEEMALMSSFVVKGVVRLSSLMRLYEERPDCFVRAKSSCVELCACSIVGSVDWLRVKDRDLSSSS